MRRQSNLSVHSTQHDIIKEMFASHQVSKIHAPHIVTNAGRNTALINSAVSQRSHSVEQRHRSVSSDNGWNWQDHATHDRINPLQFDLNMDLRDQALIQKALSENADAALRHKLLKKYNLYYSHWLDYCVLVTFLAMIGLIVGVIEWERLYDVEEGR